MNANLPVRGSDQHGSGHYGASRGNRIHNGIDFACYPGTEIKPFTAGQVTKLGYPYADDLSFRYVQVTDAEGNACRYFYVDPMVVEGDEVDTEDVIGISQTLSNRYPGITEHVHFEVERDGENVDPQPIAGV